MNTPDASVRKHRRIPPGLVLLLMAPVLGELVSGHQAPAEFFNPLVFLFLCLPYGFGAVICRECIVRWKRGWPSLLLLALAYGFYEEGIVVRSIFNQDWSELTASARTGYFGGVNWIYAFGLIHFHVLVSITGSVMLTEVLYPKRRKESWVGDKGLAVCCIGLLAWWPLGWLMTQYAPPVGWHAGVILGTVGLVIAARYCPVPKVPKLEMDVVSPRRFFVLGMVANTTVFLLAFMLPETGIVDPIVLLIPLFLVEAGAFWIVIRWSGKAYCWDDRHRLGWISGVMMFFIVFAVLADLEEEWTGKSIVGVVSLVLFWRLWRRVNTRYSAGEH